jgi:GAF domain-containing protein
MDARPLGAMCLVDIEPREWSDLELHMLSTLAQAAGAEIALREAEAELTLLRPQVQHHRQVAQR